MREISCDEIASAAERLCVKAVTVLPPALAIMLECAYESETLPAAASELEGIVENFKNAAFNGLPICKNAAVIAVFADIGQDVHVIDGLFEDAVRKGVLRCYDRGLIQKPAAIDRCTCAEDSSPYTLHVRLMQGEGLTLQILPVCAGNGNMSALHMFTCTDTNDAIEDFIIKTVSEAGAALCPPVVLGIGLGGTAADCVLAAGRALLRSADSRSGDGFFAGMERRLLGRINRLGIGPCGLGGAHTAIAVNIEACPVSAENLFCAVNISCHAARCAKIAL